MHNKSAQPLQAFRSLAGSVVALVGCALLAGCATHEIRITGVCSGPNQAPRAGIVVKHMEIGRANPFLPVLPSVEPKAAATTDQDGKFSLVVRTRHEWMIQVEDPAWRGVYGGSARIKVPEALQKDDSLVLNLTVDQGLITPEWKK